VLYLGLPDQRQTFDRDRELTTAVLTSPLGPPLRSLRLAATRLRK
jgi:hypothetical protein